MQYIFFKHYDGTSDHCEECGGEQYEGSCGLLNTYLIVTTAPFHGEVIPVVESSRLKTVCDACADAIHSHSKETV